MQEIKQLMTRLEDTPGLKSSRDWAVLQYAVSFLPDHVSATVFTDAANRVQWEDKAVSLLEINDDRLSLDELYKAFNDVIPVWVLGIITQDDLRPSDIPVRKAREEINIGIEARGLNRENRWSRA